MLHHMWVTDQVLVASSYPNELEIHKTALEQKLGYADSKYIVYMCIERYMVQKMDSFSGQGPLVLAGYDNPREH